MSNVPIDFAILPTNTDELGIANIQNNVRLLNALWSSADDTIDVTHGAFASLVVHPAATLLEGGKQAFALARRSSSFTALAQDNADAASIQMLDELAKSYCVQRRVGKRATGTVRVVYSASVQTVISSGTVFEARGFRFVPIKTVTAVASSDSLLLQTGAVNFRKMPDSSNYVFFDVEVSATTNGSVGNLVKGTELTISNIIPNYCLYAFVLETFTNGEDDESNAELVARMQLGISAKVLSSRTNMRAALLEKFPDIRDSSVIGAGDIEMTRDKRSLIPISTGGFADWYIGTSRQLLTTRYNLKEIRKWSDNPDGTVNYWATITNDDIPCLYSIISVEDGETLERYEVTTETREVNVTGGSNTPQIAVWSNSEDGFFSSYQVTNFHFTAPQGIKQIIVSAYYAPMIREIQEWVLNCEQAPLGLDVLVKAAIPTTIQFSCIIHIPVGVQIDHDGLQNSVASHINRLPFNGLLTVSGLTSLLHNQIPSNCFISKPALFATTLLPDGTKAITQTEDVLTLSYPPFVSNRTSLFFCDPADVSFEVRYIETTTCK